MDKKVSSKIWSLVNTIAPGTSKNINWSEAWEKLSEWGGFEGGVDTKSDGSTTMDIWVGDQKVKVLPITNGWNEKERDWNWHEVFSQTLNYIFEEGLIKKPRARRKDAKTEKAVKVAINRTKIAQISQETENLSNSIAQKEIAQNKRVFEAQWFSEKNLEELKRRLGNLTVKRNNYNKKGKDITPINEEINTLRNQIKEIKEKL